MKFHGLPGGVVLSLKFYNISCFWALGTLNNVKRYILTFGQRLKTAVLDVRKVDKDIAALFFGNESKTLGIIEPFNGTFCHSGRTSFRRVVKIADNVTKKTAKRKIFAASLITKTSELHGNDYIVPHKSQVLLLG
jgi:hypothetical protein